MVDTAGVEVNDIILKLNGERIDSATELKESLADKKGEAIALLVKDKETEEESIRLINNNQDAIGIIFEIVLDTFLCLSTFKLS